MKKMVVTIKTNGTSTVEVEGAVGTECESFTNDQERAIGQTEKREYLERYYDDDLSERTHVSDQG